ncbi:hypothetical protein [Pseudomonas nitroreducens]|nr:hypothetical protein [Pseudomonas nitroreducens]
MRANDFATGLVREQARSYEEQRPKVGGDMKKPPSLARTAAFSA